MKEYSLIRKAEKKDAEQFCEVIRTSIVELCELDHQNDKEELEDWLANKTVQNCQKWIDDKSANSFVAEKNGKTVGVSHIGHNGYLFLCYVLPEVQGEGFGKRLLDAAETSVLNFGLQTFNLESTITAKGFYENQGYSNVGESKNYLEYVKRIKF